MRQTIRPTKPTLLHIVRTIPALAADSCYRNTSSTERTGIHWLTGSRNEMIFPCGNIIRQYLRQNKPCTQGQMPAAYDSALKESVWQTLQNNAEWKKGFDDNMTARNKLYSMPWHVKFPAEQKLSGASPASEASDRPIIVDVGGNQGVDLQRFAEHLPKLQCTLILQDLPETLNGIHGFLDPRIKLTAYDFFTEQPVKGKSLPSLTKPGRAMTSPTLITF